MTGVQTCALPILLDSLEPAFDQNLETAQTNKSEARTTTMTSMVRFAIIVLMAERELRFLSIAFLTHLVRPIFSFFPLPLLLFSIQIRFPKNRGVQTRHHDSLTWVCYLVTV